VSAALLTVVTAVFAIVVKVSGGPKRCVPLLLPQTGLLGPLVDRGMTI